MSEKRDQFYIGVNIFIIKEEKLLLGMRKNITGDSTWALPGGHLEDGESLTQAAGRELHEETGMTAENLKFAIIANTPQEKGIHYIQLGFIAEGVDGDPQLREPEKCSEWRWWNMNDLPNKIFSGHDRLINAFIHKQPLADI